jgi:polysaccharide pyruvyl transferase WcaK-like protein
MENKKDNLKVLLLDVAQQSNAGDDIMQVALISLIRKYISQDILPMAYFGSNEFKDVELEFSGYKEKYGLNVISGFAPTFYKKRKKNKILQTLVRFTNVFKIFSILFLMKLGLGKLLMSSGEKESYESILASDIVIWNGRNFRGGNGKLSEFLKVVELCFNPLMCIALKKPIYCVGSSVWPLDCKLTKLLMEYIINKSNIFYVRESKSFNYSKFVLNISTDRLKQMYDLSFYELNNILIQNPELFYNKDSRTIAVTLVGRREFSSENTYKKYLSAYINFVAYAHKHNYKVKVIPQVTFDLEPYNEVVEQIKLNNPDADIEVVEKKLDILGLIKEYCNSRALVASRMHSAIFASSAGIPVTAVSYDSGGKWAILNDIGVNSELVVDSESVNSETLIKNFEKLISIFVPCTREHLSILALGSEEVFKEIMKDYRGNI